MYKRQREARRGIARAPGFQELVERTKGANVRQVEVGSADGARHQRAGRCEPEGTRQERRASNRLSHIPLLLADAEGHLFKSDCWSK